MKDNEVLLYEQIHLLRTDEYLMNLLP